MKILSLKEQKDGSLLAKYQLSKKEEQHLRNVAKDLGVRFSKKFCNNIILKALETSINNQGE